MVHCPSFPLPLVTSVNSNRLSDGPALRLNTRQKGASAEEVAAGYLVSNGYEIVRRNYRKRAGEIDCIARDKDGTTVFVEVKSAGTSACGSPFSWVTPAKQRTLAKVAKCFLYEQGTVQCACRFDVIVVMDGKVDHLRNAFLVR